MPYTPNNIYYPDDSGPFQPAADMAQMASSIDLRIADQNEIRSVANTTERNALVNAVGLPNITTNQPLMVWRADAPVGTQLEYTTNGTTWHNYKSSEYVEPSLAVPWTTMTPNTSAFTWNYFKWRVTRNGIVEVRVSFSAGSIATMATQTMTDAGTIPARYSPEENSTAGMYLQGARGGTLLVRANGSLAIVNNASSAATNGFGYMSYPMKEL